MSFGLSFNQGQQKPLLGQVNDAEDQPKGAFSSFSGFGAKPGPSTLVFGANNTATPFTPPMFGQSTSPFFGAAPSTGIPPTMAFAKPQPVSSTVTFNTGTTPVATQTTNASVFSRIGVNPSPSLNKETSPLTTPFGGAAITKPSPLENIFGGNNTTTTPTFTFNSSQMTSQPLTSQANATSTPLNPILAQPPKLPNFSNFKIENVAGTSAQNAFDAPLKFDIKPSELVGFGSRPLYGGRAPEFDNYMKGYSDEDDEVDVTGDEDDMDYYGDYLANECEYGQDDSQDYGPNGEYSDYSEPDIVEENKENEDNDVVKEIESPLATPTSHSDDDRNIDWRAAAEDLQMQVDSLQDRLARMEALVTSMQTQLATQNDVNMTHSALSNAHPRNRTISTSSAKVALGDNEGDVEDSNQSCYEEEEACIVRSFFDEATGKYKNGNSNVVWMERLALNNSQYSFVVVVRDDKKNDKYMTLMVSRPIVPKVQAEITRITSSLQKVSLTSVEPAFAQQWKATTYNNKTVPNSMQGWTELHRNSLSSFYNSGQVFNSDLEEFLAELRAGQVGWVEYYAWTGERTAESDVEGNVESRPSQGRLWYAPCCDGREEKGAMKAKVRCVVIDNRLEDDGMTICGDHQLLGYIQANGLARDPKGLLLWENNMNVRGSTCKPVYVPRLCVTVDNLDPEDLMDCFNQFVLAARTGNCRAVNLSYSFVNGIAKLDYETKTISGKMNSRVQICSLLSATELRMLRSLLTYWLLPDLGKVKTVMERGGDLATFKWKL